MIPTMVAAADPDILDEVIDEALLEEEDSGEESLRYEITSYGADYDVDGLEPVINFARVIAPG